MTTSIHMQSMSFRRISSRPVVLQCLEQCWRVDLLRVKETKEANRDNKAWHLHQESHFLLDALHLAALCPKNTVGLFQLSVQHL